MWHIRGSPSLQAEVPFVGALTQAFSAKEAIVLASVCMCSSIVVVDQSGMTVWLKAQVNVTVSIYSIPGM